MKDKEVLSRGGWMSTEDIPGLGFEALIRDLGPVGAARFLQQFDMGSGDWTKERHEILDKVSLDDIRDKLGTARQ